MPFGLDFFQAYRKLSAHQFLGALGIVAQDIVHSQELRLFVLDYTGVGGQAYLAVGAGVEGVYGLVRGGVVVQLDDYLGLLCGVVVYLAYLDLPFFVGFQYGVYKVPSSDAIRYLRDDQSVFIDFLYIGTHSYAASAQSPVVG